MRLVKMGCNEVDVCLKGVHSRHVEIRAKGDQTDVFGAFPEGEEDGIGFRINGCLLEQYADQFTCQIKDAVRDYIRRRISLVRTGCKVVTIDAFPTNEAGKVLYGELLELVKRARRPDGIFAVSRRGS